MFSYQLSIGLIMNVYEIFEETFSLLCLPLNGSNVGHAVFDDGFIVPYNDPFWEYRPQETVEIYSQKETWIQYLKIRVNGVDEDIIAYFEDHNGQRQKMPVTGRETDRTKKIEVITLKCSSFANAVFVQNASNHNVKILGYLLVGKTVKEFTDNIIEGQKIWEHYSSNEDDLKKALNVDIAKATQELDELKRSAEKLKQTKQSLIEQNRNLNDSIELANQQQITVGQYVDNEQKKLQKLKEEIEQVEESLKKEQNLFETYKRRNKEHKDDIDNLLNDLNIVKDELAEFEAKKQLYSEDFYTFKSGVKGDNVLYSGIMLVLAFIGGELLLQVRNSADILIQQFDKGEVVDIWALLVSRLPMISVNILCATFFIAIFHMLINLIVSNNKRVNDVKQIAYLVKQISEVQASGLELDDNFIYEKRIQSKLDLVRELFLYQSAKNDSHRTSNSFIKSFLNKSEAQNDSDAA